MALWITDNSVTLGADGTVLTANAASTHGIKFATPGSVVGQGQPFFRSTGMTVPLAASFAGQMGSLTSTTDKSDRLQVIKASAATNMALLYIAVPTAPYTIDVCGSLTGVANSGDDSLIGIARSDGTKLQVVWGGMAAVAANNTPFVVQKWNTTTGTVVTSASSLAAINPQVFYLRIIDDATTCFYKYSNNGKDYIQAFSEARNTFLTATRVGVAFYYTRPAGFDDGKFAVYDFTVTASALGDAA